MAWFYMWKIMNFSPKTIFVRTDVFTKFTGYKIKRQKI